MSIKKVADIAGVSIATVSRFINNPNKVKEETRHKVEEAIRQIQYRPNSLAQNFRRGQCGLIVVIVRHIGDPMYHCLTNSISQVAHNNGYDVFIKEVQDKNLSLEQYQNMVDSKQADGFITLVGLPQSDKHDAARLKKLPLVLAGEPSPTDTTVALSTISINNYKAATDATEHLLSLGHQHIVFMTHAGESITHIKRKEGFLGAIAKRNSSTSTLHGDVNNEQNDSHYTDSIIHIDNLPSSMEKAIQQLAQFNPRTTALVCVDDDIAIEALTAAKKQGLKIPQDLSIIGFNNIRYAEKTDPPLTTIGQPMSDIGEHAMATLHQMIKNKQQNQTNNTSNIVLEHRVIIRSSTCPPSFNQ